MLFDLSKVTTEEELYFLLESIKDPDNRRRFQRTIDKIKEKNKHFIRCKFCNKNGGTLRKWENPNEKFYYHERCMELSHLR